MVKHRNPLQSAFHLSLLLHNLNKEAERRTGLSIAQWSIIKHILEMPGISAQELADTVKLHPSTLSQSLKRLTRKKLILVLEDPRDSRKKIISLTRNGKSALDQAEIQMAEIASRLARTENELYSLEECLSSFLDRQDPQPEGAL